MVAGPNPRVWTQWQWRTMMALALVISSFCVAASASHIARASGLLLDWPTQRDIETDIPAGPPTRWLAITRVEPDGAAERAGLRSGDLVRSEVLGVPPDAVLAPGVRLPLVVDRAGRLFTKELIAPTQPALSSSVSFVLASQGLAGLVSVTLGIVLLLSRGRQNRAAAMLGMLLQCLAFTAGGYGQVWAPTLNVSQITTILASLPTGGICYFLPMAALALSEPQRADRETRTILVLAVLLAVAGGGLSLVASVPVRISVLIRGLPWLLAAMLCLTCIIRNYRQNDASSRNRIKIVLVAFASYFASVALFLWFIGAGLPSRLVWVMVGSATFGLLGPTLITYSILRQRLFDLNFVLNRTLVYAVVSFILLAAFGLAEWSVEHLVPSAWHNGGTLFSAAIALALFLSFHRLRDWVERIVERLLFSSWHRNEATLRRFVAAVAHYEQALALCQTFNAEVSRFAHGAPAALYLREGSVYKRRAGSLAGARATLAADDRALALMRAERRPIRLAYAHSSLPGALALPMLDQSMLAGFVLLAQKGDKTDYRPDELEVLGWATEQVGFALQAQRLHKLQTENASLKEKVTALAHEKDWLSAQSAGGSVRLVR